MKKLLFLILLGGGYMYIASNPNHENLLGKGKEYCVSLYEKIKKSGVEVHVNDLTYGKQFVEMQKKQKPSKKH